ncbi:MAG: hypothetical protein M0R20_03725 [Candidatus Omnitrophica bacterium]|nr:hypothetical protein [Candidatus Omnitrophota bacterium]
MRKLTITLAMVFLLIFLGFVFNFLIIGNNYVYSEVKSSKLNKQQPKISKEHYNSAIALFNAALNKLEYGCRERLVSAGMFSPPSWRGAFNMARSGFTEAIKEAQYSLMNEFLEVNEKEVMHKIIKISREKISLKDDDENMCN